MENFDECFESFKYVKENKEENIDTCCDDKNNHTDYDGSIICSKCNKIISNILENPEWKNYGKSSTNTTRCGLPINSLLPKSSIGSCVALNGKGSNMYRIKKYQKWNEMPYKERSLYKIFSDIKRICSENDIPQIISETSCSIYNIVSSSKISRGNNRKGIIAACVYFACKECNVPRSTQEISQFFNIKIAIVTKGCKNVQELMHKDNYYKTRLHNTNIVSLDDFIERFCHKLNIDINHVEKIKLISQKSKEKHLVNDNTPPSMAAGCIYLYIKNNNLKITKKYISEICKISEVTINKCYRKLEENLNLS
tara:strand:+ start:47 stop:976 length:930 start_codon:yes stop_codon:yes gene_type:complete